MAGKEKTAVPGRECRGVNFTDVSCLLSPKSCSKLIETINPRLTRSNHFAFDSHGNTQESFLARLFAHGPSGHGSEDETRQLVARVNSGDARALTELVARYRKQVVSHAYQITGDYDDDADIAQNVFIKLSRHLSRYDPTKRFYTWLYRITLNAGIDFLRRQRRHQHEPLEAHVDWLCSPHPSPEEICRRKLLMTRLKRSVRTLSEPQRSVFLMRDIEGRSVADVAGAVGIPEATVRWHLARARRSIRRSLSPASWWSEQSIF
ncbi:MAG: RNA polymerase sigma factor, partial [Candidatus Zixiibacteriota bacterium]